jgi:hypothetical protein
MLMRRHFPFDWSDFNCLEILCTSPLACSSEAKQRMSLRIRSTNNRSVKRFERHRTQEAINASDVQGLRNLYELGQIHISVAGFKFHDLRRAEFWTRSASQLIPVPPMFETRYADSISHLGQYTRTRGSDWL